MKKIIDSKLIRLLAIIVVGGIIFGIVFLIMANNIDKNIIKEELIDYYSQIKTSKITITSLIKALNPYIITITLIIIFQSFYILSPLILFINFYKGMQLGYLLSSLIITYKSKSIIYMLAIMPENLAILLVIMIYSTIMLKYSKELYKLTKDNKSLDIKLYIKRITIIYIITLIIIAFISLIGAITSKILINTLM